MKTHANKGVKRNKKPLRNIVYEVEISQLKNAISEEEREKFLAYKFKEEGYLVLFWKYQSGEQVRNWHGFITPEFLKELIGDKQWSKFCQGKRTFVSQRRVDGKNISKK